MVQFEHLKPLIKEKTALLKKMSIDEIGATLNECGLKLRATEGVSEYERDLYSLLFDAVKVEVKRRDDTTWDDPIN
jgi:hypothetical protein